VVRDARRIPSALGYAEFSRAEEGRGKPTHGRSSRHNTDATLPPVRTHASTT